MDMLIKWSSIQLLTLALIYSPGFADAASLVPGTGTREDEVGDNFEDSQWSYSPNLPKSSRNIDKRERRPWGGSANGRWLEGPHRGTPDFLKRVDTPMGGISGSNSSLLIQTRFSGVPGRPSYKEQQDDLLVNVRNRLGGPISTARSPSVVARVYVPPFHQWEKRTGTSFAFRADLRGQKGRRGKLEQYWPGMFLQFRSQSDRGQQDDSAYLILRAQDSGHDFRGPEVVPGWWTLGMSFTPNGQVHFYASQGVDDLTQEDFLASRYCYGYRATQFHMFFFNVLSRDDGRTWSTPWVIDDPSLYLAKGGQRIARQR